MADAPTWVMRGRKWAWGCRLCADSGERWYWRNLPSWRAAMDEALIHVNWHRTWAA